MPVWDRLQRASAVSHISKKWMETVKINQRCCSYWNIYEKPVINHCKMVSSSLSHSPDPLSPLHALVSFFSYLDTFDFYKHSSLWGIRSGRENWLGLIIWTALKVAILKQSHLWKAEAIPSGPWELWGFLGRPDQSFSVVWGSFPPGVSHMYRHTSLQLEQKCHQ